mmetsp:Transcript_918/g.2465  ORF Transcript_918/g.2465 Transcript_918/m.2465 type:complete len:252 (-) Transcript_918:1563-2318(-)
MRDICGSKEEEAIGHHIKKVDTHDEFAPSCSGSSAAAQQSNWAGQQAGRQQVLDEPSELGAHGPNVHAAQARSWEHAQNSSLSASGGQHARSVRAQLWEHTMQQLLAGTSAASQHAPPSSPPCDAAASHAPPQRSRLHMDSSIREGPPQQRPCSRGSATHARTPSAASATAAAPLSQPGTSERSPLSLLQRTNTAGRALAGAPYSGSAHGSGRLQHQSSQRGTSGAASEHTSGSTTVTHRLIRPTIPGRSC